MARPPKIPPPDTVGNVRGRIRRLKMLARMNVSIDVREGVDEDRATAKRAKEIKPALKKLQRRLEKARKAAGGSAPVAASETSSRKKQSPKKAKKAKTSKRSSKKGDDLLSTLDSL